MLGDLRLVACGFDYVPVLFLQRDGAWQACSSLILLALDIFGHLWTKVAICCYEKNRHPELCHLVPLKVAGKLDLGAAACSHYGTYCSDL
jgi:hypothetical protein